MQYNSLADIDNANQVTIREEDGLERLCAMSIREGLRRSDDSRIPERLEARFHGNGFLPHRHDTYALGLTLHGVQTFQYRGSRRFSQPGNVIVLHPDEVHDGAAGTEAGLIYRMTYVPPELVSAIFHHNSELPFVADPVIADSVLRDALADILGDLDHDPDELMLDDAMARIAAGLCRHAGTVQARIQPVARSAVLAAREYLDAHRSRSVRSGDLESVTGLDRYELARHFRRMLGTSPHRYLIMRRLDWAKRMLARGESLADAAADSGFADQAHFTRHFRNAFGMPPGRWLSLQRTPG